MCIVRCVLKACPGRQGGVKKSFGLWVAKKRDAAGSCGRRGVVWCGVVCGAWCVARALARVRGDQQHMHGHTMCEAFRPCMR